MVTITTTDRHPRRTHIALKVPYFQADSTLTSSGRRGSLLVITALGSSFILHLGHPLPSLPPSPILHKLATHLYIATSPRFSRGHCWDAQDPETPQSLDTFRKRLCLSFDCTFTYPDLSQSRALLSLLCF